MTLIMYDRATQPTMGTIEDYPDSGLDLAVQYFSMREKFGPKLLSYILATDEIDDLGDQTAGGPNTSLPYLYNGRKIRLSVLFEVSQMILSVDSVLVLRMWILGKNPVLDFIPPATKIREGEFAQVMAAADSHLAGGL